jgi:hypothetical protein
MKMPSPTSTPSTTAARRRSEVPTFAHGIVQTLGMHAMSEQPHMHGEVEGTQDPALHECFTSPLPEHTMVPQETLG